MMMNLYMHYGEISEQLRKSREILSDILQAINVTPDLELLQQIKQHIVMENKRIEDLQEQENQWFHHSRTTIDEVHWIVERTYRLLHQEK